LAAGGGRFRNRPRAVPAVIELDVKGEERDAEQYRKRPSLG